MDFDDPYLSLLDVEDAPEKLKKTRSLKNNKAAKERALLGPNGYRVAPDSPLTPRGRLIEAPADNLTIEEELFCKDYAHFGNLKKAYERAFPYSIPEAGAEAAGRLLATRHDIRTYTTMLRLGIIQQSDVSLSTLLTELEEERQAALAGDKIAAAIAATMGKARLTGLDRTVVEHTGTVGHTHTGSVAVQLSAEEVCKRMAYLMNANANTIDAQYEEMMQQPEAALPAPSPDFAPRDADNNDLEDLL